MQRSVVIYFENSFGGQQTSSLKDYVEANLILHILFVLKQLLLLTKNEQLVTGRVHIITLTVGKMEVIAIRSCKLTTMSKLNKTSVITVQI